MTSLQAQRRTVPAEEPLLCGERPDYADSFEIDLLPNDVRTPEQLGRDALLKAPPPLRFLITLAHRWVLGFPARQDILGFRVLHSDDDVVHLEARSGRLRGVLVGRRENARHVVLSSYVWFPRRGSRALWVLAGPVHRRVAPVLLERAARGGA